MTSGCAVFTCEMQEKRDFSLRRPTHSQERMRKKKSACSVRNDVWRGGPNEVGVRVLIDLTASENVQLVNKQCDRASSESSASDKEKVLRSPVPPTDRFRPYQSWSLALGSVAHVEGIAIRKVRGDIAVIADRNIGALFSKLDVVAVVFEAMGKQTGSAIFAPRHCSN